MACDLCFMEEGQVYRFSWNLMCMCGCTTHPMVHGIGTYQRYIGTTPGKHHFRLLGNKIRCPETGNVLAHLHFDCEDFEGFDVSDEFQELNVPVERSHHNRS